MIISSKDTNGLRIIYEETSKMIPSLTKEKTLGYLKMFPTDFEKVQNI
jgi:hypothetical protein